MRKFTLGLGAFLLVLGVGAQNGNRIKNVPFNTSVQTPQQTNFSFNQNSNQNVHYVSDDRCGMLQHEDHLRSTNPNYDAIKAQGMLDMEEAIKNMANSPKKGAVYTLPTVVHVVYNTAAQNLSDAQIQNMMDLLNADFRRTNSDAGNTPSAFQGLAADMEIQFCLASTDPNGQPTTGIIHKSTSVTSFSTNDAVKFDAQGGSTAWPTDKYFNIWVCNMGGGILGYGEFPTPGLSNTYGAVSHYCTVPGPNACAPYNENRTMTHELSHCFNLYHTWGDDGGACSGSDQVADTPNQADATTGCRTFPATDACTPSGDGIMFMNYMDYSNDNCMNMFTVGQRDRAKAAVQTYLSSVYNNTAACSPAVLTADFAADVTTVNVGGSVNFTDLSTSPNTITSWNWTFTGGTPNSFIGQNPPAITYNTVGQYTVSLTVNDGGSDTETKTQYINVINAAACDTLLNIDLNADTLTLYGSAGDQNLVGWNEYAITDNAEKYENYAPYTYVSAADVYIAGVTDGGNGATVTLNVWDDNGGVPNQILGSAVYNLSDLANAVAGNGGQGVLNLPLDAPVNVGNGPFYIGFTYAGFNENAGDSLGLVSNRIDNRPNNTGYAYFNGSWSAWSSLIGGNLSTFVSPYMSLDVPNATITTNTATICETESVNFDASNSTGTAGYNWVFNGGNPANSTNTTETVSYASQGNYWAYLVADGECGGFAVDSVEITVNPGTTPTFNQVAAICSGETLSALPTTSNNGISGTWSPALDNTQTTTYTFTPNGGQCGTTTTMTITVNQPATPTFTQVAPICTGDNLDPLPTTSNNGVTGTWSPALDNTQTTQYTFTPNGGQCATTTTMTITVNSSPTAPTFNQVADICSGDNLAALPTSSTEGVTGTWSPALDNTQTTQYTFTPDGGQCATTTTMTITVNQNVTPTFNQVADICSGDNLSALPTTSNNGVAGTWSPALDNTQTTQYTFTPNGGQCATTTTMTITVNQNVTPTFNQVADICSGDNLSALPTTSNNGVTGTWLPALDNTQTTTYTFTPNGGQCATTTTMTITVNSSATPTFTQVDPICSGDNLSALPTTSNNGVTGTWSPALDNTQTTTYTFTPNNSCSPTASMTITVNAADAATIAYGQATYCANDNNPTPSISGTTGGTFSSSPAGLVIDPNTGEIDVVASTANETYVVTYSTNGSCPTTDNAVVTIAICPGIAENGNGSITIAPNPASTFVAIKTINVSASEIKLVNILGETLMNAKVTSTTTNMNVSELPLGVYFVQVMDNSGKLLLTEKMVKK